MCIVSTVSWCGLSVAEMTEGDGRSCLDKLFHGSCHIHRHILVNSLLRGRECSLPRAGNGLRALRCGVSSSGMRFSSCLRVVLGSDFGCLGVCWKPLFNSLPLTRAVFHPVTKLFSFSGCDAGAAQSRIYSVLH